MRVELIIGGLIILGVAARYFDIAQKKGYSLKNWSKAEIILTAFLLAMGLCFIFIF